MPAPRPKTKVLRAVRPNAGVEVAFRRRLQAEIEAMYQSTVYWLNRIYAAHPPVMQPVIAMDRIPANELRDALAMLSRQWLYRFDRLAEWLAEHFTKDAAERSDTAMQRALQRAGFTIGRFTMTPAMADVLAATVNENVSLIKSIPQQYLHRVEGLVMRSVQTGRDLGTLSSQLQHQFGVTKKRAALIARDQNNKATSALTRVRQQELGIKYAIWMHSGAGREPRPTHVRMDGKKYDISRGLYDSNEGRNVFPGELINCRCTSRPVIQGFA